MKQNDVVEGNLKHYENMLNKTFEKLEIIDLLNLLDRRDQ